MRVGISLSSTHAVDDPRDGARRMLERTRAARDAGLDTLSVGDNHTTAVPYYQNTPMLGRLLAEWDDRPSGCLFLLPLWHPVLVAEQVGTLASLTDGVFILQAGIGGGEQRYAAMSGDLRTRGRAMDESIRVVKALLGGERVDSDHFGLRDAVVALRPRAPVDWWLAGSAPAAIDRAAREGDAWYADPALTPATAPPFLEAYREACGRHGRAPHAIVRKDVVVLADGDEATRLGNTLVEGGYRGLDRDAVAYGTPESVAEQLAPFAEMGFDDVIVRCMTVPQHVALETIGQLAAVRRLLA